MSHVTRRQFVRTATLAAAATQLAGSLRAANGAGSSPGAFPGVPAGPLPTDRVELRWLEGKPASLAGATWGTAWPRGRHPLNTPFALRTRTGESVPVQSWPLATWPDGSLKWTGHALAVGPGVADDYELVPGMPTVPATSLTVVESAETIEIDTGVIRCRIARRGATLFAALLRDGREIARDGRLICLRQDGPELTAGGIAQREEFVGELATVTVEQRGPVRAVVKLEGRHRLSPGVRAAVSAEASKSPRGADETITAPRQWLPFVVRLYFYAGSEAVRLMHTIIYDGDEQHDFIAGLGVRFMVPMRDPLYDRHVRFVGQDGGLWAEAVQNVTGLRRDPGAAVRAAQIAGRACPPLAEWDRSVSDGLQYVPVWSDSTLTQLSADGFEVRKRTKPGFTWIKAGSGQRAGGTGYVGGPSGGLAFGLRNFWESYPAQLAIHGAGGEAAEVTVWLWSPEAAPMDLRGYHDGMGEDTYAKQVAAMNVTYEDYEPGFDRPEGVARTSEVFMWALASTPERERLVAMGDAVRTPPMLVARPEYLHACNVFGGLWAPVNRSSAAHLALEEQLDWYFRYYQGQREQRHWYGFWNYGDVMHSYDADRHSWRYDVGGFAWDNSELSTDLWLWLYFLRTGRADVFRFAEAMTRHTGEVDVHHLGRFAPLGSRHNVLHWGCSAKQLRISTAANRRYYYFLTADERVGDLMREQIEAARALVRIQPGRKVGGRTAEVRPSDAAEDTEHARVGFGTDWGALAAAWLTEWERTGDPRIRERLVTSMRTIGAQPKGFFSSGSRMNLTTGEFDRVKSDRAAVSHLNAVFGLVEICAELLQLIDEPSFARAWLDYCELYNAPAEEQERRLGSKLRGTSLRQAHSRLTAFAARVNGDDALAARAWSEYFEGDAHRPPLRTTRLTGPAVLTPVDEAAFVSTNATAQWGLATIECLALVGSAGKIGLQGG